MSKPIEIDNTTTKIQRNFTETDKISKHLTCTICRDIFYEPSRVGCGHTFCLECIEEWLNSSGQCPICRKVLKQNQISKDLVASNIINDLEVTCNNEFCPWRGTVGELERHLGYCYFDKKRIGNDIKDIFKKDNSSQTKNETENPNYYPFNTEINTQSSLKARLYEKNPELMINSLKRTETKEISVMDLLELSTSDRELEKIFPNSNPSERKGNHEVINLYEIEEEEKENSSPKNNNINVFSINNSSSKENQFVKEIKEKTKKKLTKTKKQLLGNKAPRMSAPAQGGVIVLGKIE
jgi:hypothetical protein